MITIKTLAECLNDTLIADRMFLNGMMTFTFWMHVQELNKGIVCDAVEAMHTEAVLSTGNFPGKLKNQSKMRSKSNVKAGDIFRHKDAKLGAAEVHYCMYVDDHILVGVPLSDLGNGIGYRKGVPITYLHCDSYVKAGDHAVTEEFKQIIDSIPIDGRSEDGVTIMTGSTFSGKGMKWKVVFLAGGVRINTPINKKAVAFCNKIFGKKEMHTISF